MDQNRTVLCTFIAISILIAVSAFGTFFLCRAWIPVWFPSISRSDSPFYACIASVIASQIVFFTFYFWAWNHDVAEEKREQEAEALKGKAKQD
jgi:phosphotransferase system  glucose/maltose/N-acetylglucosamine-specific IIC component